MKKTICYFVLLLLSFLQAGCNKDNSSIESIIMDYPHGETRLHVRRNGAALLFYGARPEHHKVKNGTFDIDELYEQLKTRLHDNIPREEWPNPRSKAGMVTIDVASKAEKVYLIFDEEEFTEHIFYKARQNIVGQVP